MHSKRARHNDRRRLPIAGRFTRAATPVGTLFDDGGICCDRPSDHGPLVVIAAVQVQLASRRSTAKPRQTYRNLGALVTCQQEITTISKFAEDI
jgi:hypothetical protein